MLTKQYKLEEDGFTILKNIFNNQQIEQLASQYNNCWNKIITNWHLIQWNDIKISIENQPNTGYIGKELYNGSKIAVINIKDNEKTEKNTTIIDMGNGRYDFTYGLTDIFVKCNLNKQFHIINDIIKSMLEYDYEFYIGGLPIYNEIYDNMLKKKYVDGKWHRDAYSFFDDEEIDMKLKPFYYTVLIPLFDIIEESARSTEFILGSHKLNLQSLGISNRNTLNTWCNTNPCKYKLQCNKGDVCIFHGYLIHRGTGTGTDIDNGIIYIVFKKKWYNDEPDL
jgi:hypothetical protein